MIDILIPLGGGSRHNNLELRYCLRSIEKHLTGVLNIFIVAGQEEVPNWVRNITHVVKEDNPNNWRRAHNIYSKILAGINKFDIKFSMDAEDIIKNQFTVEGSAITDNFLFVNDDHFLLKDYEAGDFPYYHRGPIDLEAMKSNQPQYIQMHNTYEWLVKQDETAYDFDIHCPIVYNKKLFPNCFPRDANGVIMRIWPEHGYGIKSIYGNRWGEGSTIKAVQVEDLKFAEPAMKESIYRALEGRDWFSIGDRCLKSGDMKLVLEELYPVKSKYEV